MKLEVAEELAMWSRVVGREVVQVEYDTVERCRCGVSCCDFNVTDVTVTDPGGWRETRRGEYYDTIDDLFDSLVQGEDVFPDFYEGWHGKEVQ